MRITHIFISSPTFGLRLPHIFNIERDWAISIARLKVAKVLVSNVTNKNWQNSMKFFDLRLKVATNYRFQAPELLASCLTFEKLRLDRSKSVYLYKNCTGLFRVSNFTLFYISLVSIAVLHVSEVD